MQTKHVLPRTDGEIEIHITKRNDGSYIVQGYVVDAEAYIPSGKVYSGPNAEALATAYVERLINS
jgi:hypothetical protein